MDGRTSLVYSRNGSIEEVFAEDPSSQVAAGVIIAVCFLSGVVYNFIVVTAVSSSDKLRRSSFHLAILLVSFICLLDCLTNESVAFGLLFGAETVWCGFSAVVFHSLLLAHSAALGLLCADGVLELLECLVTVKTCLGAVVGVWIFVSIFITPLVFGASDIQYFPNRNACCAVKTNSWFPIFHFVGFLFTLGVTATSFTVFTFFTRKNSKDEKQLNVLSIFPMSNVQFQSSAFATVKCSKNKITNTILFFHTILVVPQIVTVVMTLFFHASFEPDPWMDPRVPSEAIHSVSTMGFESLFTYLRYMYNAVVPIAILSADRDLRLQSRGVFCRRRNVIASSETSSVKGHSPQESVNQSFVDIRTPVLFSTSAGLYLRVPQKSGLQGHLGSSSISGTSVRLVPVFCDLTAASTGVEAASYGTAREETRVVQEDSPANKKNVRFSSKVDAISPFDSGATEEVWSRSGTHVVNAPLFVRGENNLTDGGGVTYSKL